MEITRWRRCARGGAAPAVLVTAEGIFGPNEHHVCAAAVRPAAWSLGVGPSAPAWMTPWGVLRPGTAGPWGVGVQGTGQKPGLRVRVKGGTLVGPLSQGKHPRASSRPPAPSHPCLPSCSLLARSTFTFALPSPQSPSSITGPPRPGCSPALATARRAAPQPGGAHTDALRAPRLGAAHPGCCAGMPPQSSVSARDLARAPTLEAVAAPLSVPPALTPSLRPTFLSASRPRGPTPPPPTRGPCVAGPGAARRWSRWAAVCRARGRIPAWLVPAPAPPRAVITGVKNVPFPPPGPSR